MKENNFNIFLKILEKHNFEVKNNVEVKNYLNYVLNIDHNIKTNNISIEHFKKKFPKFNDKVHELLSKCATKQKYDYRKYKLEIKKCTHIISFD